MNNAISKLARQIVFHSCRVIQDDLVYINVVGYSCPLVDALVKEVQLIGAIPYVHLFPNELVQMLLSSNDETVVIKTLRKWCDFDSHVTNKINCYIEIMNDKMLADLHLDNLSLYKKYYYNPTQWQCRQRIGTETRWITIRNPSEIIYAHADPTVEKSLDWIWQLYSYDYQALSLRMRPLAKLMDDTSRVHIVAEGTDVEFSIENQNVVVCDGNINIPDGEVFVSPIKESVNGDIFFNVPFWYMGEKFSYIKLKLRSGKVVDFSSDNLPGLERLLSLDEGAKFVGEFAIGTNPLVDKFIGNTLFDEKMLGTVHFALGNCIGASPNGNKSCIHMDLIVDMRYNGEIYFDGQHIFKDGNFILDQLRELNKY